MITRAKILSVATATPPHCLPQANIAASAEKLFAGRYADFSRYRPVYHNAAIETRYGCMPLEWYQQPASLSERNALYLEHALTLLAEVAHTAVAKAKLSLDDIDGLVVVSSSGIATPSLDARLMQKLQLNPAMERMPIFGLGCAGGVLGLARTAQLAVASPQKHYLYMVVELCTLNFLHQDQSKSNIIATALFGDGAAAAVISCQGEGLTIGHFAEHTFPNTLDVMGWEVIDAGLRVVFSQDIPTLIRSQLRPVLDAFFTRYNIDERSINQVLSHPGGAKVLDAIEDVLHLPTGGLAISREVLRRYGNMSAATVMFVLAEALKTPQTGSMMMTTFGPGFTAGLLMLEHE